MKFSIITISFNAEKTIKNTIESVLNQNYLDYEYIFVDGGSKDSTNEIIEHYKQKLLKKGISVKHISEKDNGISDAFNKGIALAEGEIISILNADDQFLPGALEKVSQEFDSDMDVIYGNCIWNDTLRGIRYIRKSKPFPEQLLYDMVFIHPSTFVRMEAYKKYGVFKIDYKYCMDEELLYRMYKQGASFKYLDIELTLFQAGGVSDNNPWPTWKEGERLAFSYGEPLWKVKAIKLKKVIKHNLSKIRKCLLKLLTSIKSN
ncbi:glycosyltransferase [Priestia megaterium]|uniref:glycosyltransferase family 2 protein n=1 Tax=Priestia megaterium TaxID=1404 RepID=UPI0023781D14|nr:glycosyltransferase family 2 protein [Priestia megaterium]WDM33086.1 glycosyltransferase [Priestia megaterium]